jgi:O-antigen biosynthesis protein WbqP
MIKQIFDFIMAFGALILLSAPMLIITVLVKVTSKGPVLYWSDRVGRYNKIFRMPKFRTFILRRLGLFCAGSVWMNGRSFTVF